MPFVFKGHDGTTGCAFNQQEGTSVSNKYRPWYARVWPYATAAGVGIAIWLVIALVFDTAHVMGRGLLNGVWFSWFFANGWNLFGATPFFWWVVGGLVLLVIWLKRPVKTVTKRDRYSGREYTDTDRPVQGWFKAVASLTALGLLALTFVGFWNINKSAAVHYTADNQAVYVVDDLDNIPSVLRKVEQSSSPIVNIEEGDITFDWERRVASATGAVNVMKRTGDSINNTELMAETIAYIYDDSSTGGSWTAIRNGVNRQDIYGVHVWSGTGERVVNCEFKGAYELNRAFSGMFGRNLSDDIAEFNPRFQYNANDVYGYCNGDEPIIVIPGTQTVGAGVRTVNQAYGVLTIQGSQSGNPIITHVMDAQPGDFPGAVYPKRLVDKQRSILWWSAGRCWVWEECFGLETTDVATQVGNSTNFLLRNNSDGRLYWVTPLKPRSTDSQTLVAYSVTPADEMTSGTLNQQRIYVMNDGDNRIVNLDDLENVVTDAVRTADPGFFTGDSPGRIVEFLPVSDTEWQVFAEVGGRVKYRIDVSVGARMGTQLFLVNDGAEEEAVDGSNQSAENATCDDPSTLNDAELASCISQLANELNKRING